MAEAKQNNVNKPNSSVGLHFQKTFFCHLCHLFRELKAEAKPYRGSARV